MPRKTYFRMPSFDHSPNLSVQLGQIITSPRHPHVRLADPLPIEAHRIDSNIKTDYREVVSRAQKSSLDCGFSLWPRSSALGAM